MIIRELSKDFVFLVLNEAYISYLTKTIKVIFNTTIKVFLLDQKRHFKN